MDTPTKVPTTNDDDILFPAYKKKITIPDGDKQDKGIGRI